MKKIISILLILLLLLSGCSTIPIATNPPTATTTTQNLKLVSSMSQLKTLLNASKDNAFVRWYRGIGGPIMYKTSDVTSMESNTAGNDYSQTNTQVKGVDEADTVKTDGSYIYQINDQGNVYIVSVDKDGFLNVIKQLTGFETEFYPVELYVDDTHLIVIGSSYNKEGSFTSAYIYDKSDMDNISLVKNVMIKGYYSDSRKIGDSLYLICNYSPGYYYVKDTDLLPCYIEDGVTTYQTPNDIYYFDNVDYSAYLILAGVDLSDLSAQINLNTYLGSGQTVYMSNDNLYVTYTNYQYMTMGFMMDRSSENLQTTVIHKFSASSATLEHVATAEISGYPINQFAMDEYKGFFRIAVTDNENGESINNVYIFDGNLIQTGSITNMAPGERIYSVRFNGDMGYMVTFVQVDPLFVMDLSDPYNPKIDGELKIPGYSSYMHMYSDTLILGFGMDTDVSEGGSVLQQGIKIAMFDVSDRTNPKQLFTTSIGGRGSWSELSNNHKAFMFSRERNIFAFPASIAGNNYEMKTQGLVVCKIDMANNQFEVLDILSQDYFTNWSNYVQRGLYINNILLTISSNAIYSYNFDNLAVIDNVIFD